MRFIITITAMILLFVFITGCTSNTVFPGATAGPGNPGPVVTLPAASTVDIQVNQKDPIYNTVDVVFAGGNGQVQVSSIPVTFITSDGKSETSMLKPEKGATVTFQGTKGTDRVQVTVNLYSGYSYRIIDTPVPYRTRG